jgi:hypothetical protein
MSAPTTFIGKHLNPGGYADAAFGADLFWSRVGEVACANHAPPPDDPRWAAEQWKPLVAAKRNHPLYQCQHCHRGPIAHYGLHHRIAADIISLVRRSE